MANFVQTIPSLTENFGLPGVLAFEEHGELVRAQITLPQCKAEVYLQGAQITRWQPEAGEPVLFLSSVSEFAPGKAIRGGIPVCFPWFGPDQQARAGGKPGPSHGFARTSEWTLTFAGLQSTPRQSQDVTLTLAFTLLPSALSRSLGYDGFQVVYEMTFDAQGLLLRLSVANTGSQPIQFEEALHSYFAASDVHSASIEGLGEAHYLDKADEMRQKVAPSGTAPLSGWTDRVYPSNEAEVRIHDRSADGQNRTIAIAKQNSRTTVLWNPWAELAGSMADLGDDEWLRFVCVETANAGNDAVTLAPGNAHQMEARLELIR